MYDTNYAKESVLACSLSEVYGVTGTETSPLVHSCSLP